MHESEREDEQPLDFSAVNAVAAAPVRTFRHRSRPNDPQTYIGPVVDDCAFLVERTDPDNALGVDVHSLVGVLWAACNELFNELKPLQEVASDLPGIVAASNAKHSELQGAIDSEVDEIKSWATGAIATQVGSETASRVAAQSAMTQAITGAMSTAMADEKALRQKAEADELVARTAAIGAEATARQAADQAEARTRQLADEAEAKSRQAADDAEVVARLAVAARVSTLETSLTALAARVSALDGRKPALSRATGNLPTLAVNATADVTCTWTSVPATMPELGQCAVVVSPGLGSTTATVKSVSATSVVVTVKAGVAITATTGGIQVIAATLQG